ncbi:MAG: MBL fold metallo-hydrolase [Lysobacterales bacterium]
MERQPSRLTALPVGTGDAFLWQDGGRTTLVDGGQNKLQANHEIEARSIQKIDVAICTHADADHVDGLLAILRNPRIRIGTVWVPSRWGNGLHDLIQDPITALHNLARECIESNLTNLEQESELDRPNSGTTDLVDTSALEEAIMESPDLGRVIEGLIMETWFVKRWPPLWLDSQFTLSRIWGLVRAALEAGAELRWFEYGKPPNGGLDRLKPVNSAETAKVAKSKANLAWLRLTRVNREALVFAGESKCGARVLFCSDSDLAGITKLPLGTGALLATAPHHGSEKNAGAYAAIDAMGANQNVLWVRSDRAAKRRPREVFLKIPAIRRACTTCGKCDRTPPREVIAEARGGEWYFKTASCPGAMAP